MTTIAHRDTDEYAPGKFRPHGRAQISFDGVLMRFESSGPFNLEHMAVVGMAIRELVAEVPPPGPWGEIVRLHGSALITQEVLAALESLITSLAQEGIASVATALVAESDIDGLKLMVQPYAAVYARLRRPFALFSSVAAAEAWLQTKLTAT